MKRPIGTAFELWVAELYKSKNKPNVQHDLRMKTKNYMAQFDITYGRFRKTYVECKYKSEQNVSLNAIATFYAKLELFNISSSRGVVVTNSDFTPRAKSYAQKKKITLINGSTLEEMYVSSLNYFAKRKYKKTDTSFLKILQTYVK